MCQDNIKIREEGELENESVQNVLKQPLIIRKVLESLDFSTLLQCRIVSKSWEKEATFIMAKRCKVTFKDLDSLQDFVNLNPATKGGTEQASLAIIETLLFTHASFQFDVEAEVKKKPVPDPVKTFLKIHAKQMTFVETPEGTVSGTDSVSEWTEKLLKLVNTSENNSDGSKPNENDTDNVEVKPVIADANNNSVKLEGDEQPAILDENDNYISDNSENESSNNNPGHIKLDEDESNLQEIIIHDDEIEKQVETKSKSETFQKKSSKSVHFSMVENPEYVPIPYCDEGYKTFSDFYPYYLGEHSHETGRRLHILGITNSILLIIIGTFTLTPILYAVALIQAYAFAIGAHCYFEKRFPRPTLRNPIYMVMGNLKMWWEVASGQRAL